MDRPKFPAAFPKFPAALWIATAALYASLLLLYAPSLDFRASALDDTSHLQLAAEQSPAEVFVADRYGHVRPIKSATFWLLAHDAVSFTFVRAVLLVVLVLATALVQRFATRLSGSATTGLLTAACWSLHPMVASVTTWLSAASTAAALIGMLLFLEHAQRAIAVQDAWRSRMWLVVASFELALALLSHELAAVAPVLLAGLLMLWRPTGRERSARIVLATSCALVVAWLAFATVSGELRVSYRFADQSAWLLTSSSARYVVRHLSMWLVPAGQFGVLLGDHPLGKLGESAAAWLALLLACALLWKHRAREPVFSFGLIWFLVTLAPVANVLPIGNTPIAMHYLYVPSFGLALALARASAGLARTVAPSRESTLQLALPAALLLGWVSATPRAIAAWGDDERLFALSVANYPREIEALVNLASLQMGQQRYAAAEATLTRARALAPDDLGVVHNQFALLFQTQRLDAALALLDRHPSIAARPEFQLGRGQVLVRLGRFAEAIAPLERALAGQSEVLDEDLRVGAGLQLSLALAQSDRMPEAQRLIDRLLARYPARAELRKAAQLLQR